MKEIPNHKGYFADESGKIYTTRPKGPHKIKREQPELVAQNPNPNGYLGVNLMCNGIQRRFLSHLLILETFKGKRPSKKHHGCHGKGGKQDNSIGNIDWKTISQNNWEDKIRDGTFRFGDHHGMSKLTCEKVKKIKSLFNTDLDNYSIAYMFNVTHSNISKIRRGHTWKHITN